MVLDVSGSMGKFNRLTLLKEAAHRYVFLRYLGISNSPEVLWMVLESTIG